MPTKMTPERALIVLNQCNTDGRIKVDREELKEAVKVASEAIRQCKIPKAPVDGYSACPECGGTVGNNFCPECGQAIDWREFWSAYD